MIGFKMKINSIILAGSGHGAHVAYESLKDFFSEIHLISDDEELKSSLRPKDMVVTDFMDSDAHYCVCAGYQKLIGNEIINSKTIINTHPSLLPKYRGMHSVVWALLNDEPEIGFTVHLMNNFMDDGGIIAQHKIVNDGQITSKQIMDDFDLFVLNQLGEIVSRFLAGKILPVPQDRNYATWVPRRNLDDCIVQFDMPNWQLRALFRALVRPYPLPRINIRNRIFEITDSEINDVDYYTTIGRVVNIENQTAYIKTKDGLLLVHGLMDVISGQPISTSEVLKIGQRL